MSLFGKKTDINSGVEKYKGTEGALLLDVRETDEFKKGHIPEALNLPLSSLKLEVGNALPDKDRPVFVYCLSGARSKKAAGILESLGYGQVESIGGINAYTGSIEK